MPRTFGVYTTPTHTPGIAERPNTPAFEPWLQPHEFHSYIPALSVEEARIVDEVLAYGAPVHSVTEDLERLFLTPRKRRAGPSIPKKAFEARKKSRENPGLPLRPHPSGSNWVPAPNMNPYDEEYTTFRLRASPRPIFRGPVRAPLAELPRHEFAVRSRRLHVHTQVGPPPSPSHWQHPRAAAPAAHRTLPTRPPNLGRQNNPVTPSAQPAQARVTPSTSNSCQSSSSVRSGCSSTYACPRCSPNTSTQSSRPSMSSSSSSRNSVSQSQAELDRNVRKMESLAAKGRKLRDIIPAMAAPSGVPKGWRQKTEVEKWLEKEMAI